MTAEAETTFEKVKRIFITHLDVKELRRTPERFAILEEIYTSTGHFDVEELYIRMKAKNYRVSRATVYNSLNLLVECGLVTRHQFGKNVSQYEKAYGFRQHDHLICTECSHVVEFCDPRIFQIQDMMGKLMSFDVQHHSLILYGNCKIDTCSRKSVQDQYGEHKD